MVKRGSVWYYCFLFCYLEEYDLSEFGYFDYVVI